MAPEVTRSESSHVSVLYELPSSPMGVTKPGTAGAGDGMAGGGGGGGGDGQRGTAVSSTQALAALLALQGVCAPALRKR